MANRLFAAMFVILMALFTSAVAVAIAHRKKEEM
jgi:hypothetical protein